MLLITSLVLCLSMLVMPMATAQTGCQEEPNTTIVLLDNSGTMKKLSRTYRNDIFDFLSRVAPGQRLLFAPIGPQAGLKQMLDSNKTIDENAIQASFSFTAGTTPLAESFSAYDATTAMSCASHIIIVSDMEPDHQITGKRWHFSREDIEDLKHYQTILRGWLQNNRRVTVLLHKWHEIPRPSSYSSDDLDHYPETLDETIRTIRAQQPQQINRYGFREPKSAGSVKQVAAARQRLTAMGLAWLKRDYRQQFILYAIPSHVNGQLNEEGFRRKMCAVLKEPLGKHWLDLCGTPDGLQPIQARVDFMSRGLIQGLEIEGFINSLPTQAFGKGGARSINWQVDTRGSEVSDEIQFHVKVKRESGKAYEEPTFSISGKDINSEPVVVVAEQSSPTVWQNRQEMQNWLADELDSKITDFLQTYHVLKRKRKTFIITSKDQTLDGSYFRLEIDFGKGWEDYQKQRISRDRLTMSVPRNFQEARLTMELGTDHWVNVGGFRVEDVVSSRDIHLTFDPQTTYKNIMYVNLCLDEPQLQDNLDPDDACRQNPPSFPVTVEFWQTDFLQNRHLIKSEMLVPFIRRDAHQYSIELLPQTVEVRVIPPKDKEWLVYTVETQIEHDKVLTIRLQRDRLATNWDATCYQFDDLRGDPDYLTRLHLEGSSHYFYRMFEYTAQRLKQSNPSEIQEIEKIWRTLNHALFEAQQAFNIRLAMNGIGLSEDRPMSMDILRLLFASFVGETPTLDPSKELAYQNYLVKLMVIFDSKAFVHRLQISEQ